MLTVVVSPAGAGTVNVNGMIPDPDPYNAVFPPNSSVALELNSEATLHAVAVNGYVFENWTGNENGNVNPLTFQMTCSKIVYANFTAFTPITGNLAGYVWNDTNVNSLKDPAETGKAGIVVNLFDSAPVIVASVMTGSTGSYNFNDVAPGSYQLRFIAPANYDFSPQVSLCAVNFAGLTSAISLLAGDNLSLNAGIYRPADHQLSVSFQPGWNLFSLPYYTAPGTSTCSGLVSGTSNRLDSIYSYRSGENSTGNWSGYIPAIPAGNLTEINDGLGYWLHLNQTTSLSLGGEPLSLDPASLPAYQLYAGWNLVGFKSYVPVPASDYFSNIKNKYATIYSFVGGNWHIISDSDLLTPGLGYWIYMNEDGIVYPYLQNADHINLTAAQAMIQTQANNSQFVILDVRRPSDEFELGHIAGAINLNYQAPEFQSQVSALDKTKTYLVYCKAGARTAAAVDLMKQMGFKETYNMDGGFDAWKAAGFPWVQ